MAVPLTEEPVWQRSQPDTEFTTAMPEEHLTLEAPGIDVITGQINCLRVTVVPESYSTTTAEELYFVASELVP